MHFFGGSRAYGGDYSGWGSKGDGWWWVIIMFFIFFGFMGWGRGYGKGGGSSLDAKKRHYNGVKR